MITDPDILAGLICPYCLKKTEHVEDIEIYGRSFGGMSYWCRECDAYVGCHKSRPNDTTGETGKEFYINIDLKSCQNNGFTIDASTVLWWMNQPNEAREALTNFPVSIECAIESFHEWMESIKSNECQIWANSPSFDLSLLEFAFNKFGLNQPWFYWNERDCRTLVSFNPDIKKSMVNNLPHDAISDCLYQIKYCSAIWNSININIETLKNQNNG